MRAGLQAVQKLALQCELALVELAAEFVGLEGRDQLLALLHFEGEPRQLVRMRAPGPLSLLLGRIGLEFSFRNQLNSFVAVVIEANVQFLIQVNLLILQILKL